MIEKALRTLEEIRWCGGVVLDDPTPGDIVAQAHRFVRLRWLTVACSTGLWAAGAMLGAAPWLLRVLGFLLVGVALINLALGRFYRAALQGEYPLERAALWSRWHTLTDLLFIFAALHFTGGLYSPGEVLLITYLAGVAMLYACPEVVGFTALVVMAEAFMALAYWQRWLPLYNAQGEVLPLPSIRNMVLTVSTDLVFAVIVTGLVYSLARGQRRARRMAEEERAFLMHLHALAREGLRRREVGVLAQYLADHMGRVIRADGVYLTLWDARRQQPIPLAAYGQDRERYPNLEVDPNLRPTLTDSVRRLGHAVFVPDPLNSPYLHPQIAAQFPARAVLAVPMFAHGGAFLGAAIFAFERPVALSEREVQRAEEAAQFLALVLSRALTEQRLQRQSQLLEALHRLASALAAERDARTVAQQAVEGMCALLGAAKGGCYALDEEEDALACLYAQGLSEEYVAWLLARYREVPGSAVLKGMELLLIEDVQRDPRAEGVREQALREGYRAYAVVPLVTPHGPIGALTLYWDRPHPRQDDEMLVLRLVGVYVGEALHNARLFRRLEAEATTDPLTGLPNRRAFARTLAYELARAQRYQRPFSLLMLDLNGFKAINDTYGHPVGDLVLQQVARALRRGLRNTDLVARYGGDEFVALLPETGEAQARLVAEKLRREVEALTFEGPVPQGMRCTLAVGVATYPEDGAAPETLLEAADQRMYADKPTV